MATPAWPLLDQHIRLHAVAVDGRLQANGLVSSRDGSIVGLLAARPLDDIPRLAARLFPLCGMAHAAAILAGIEQALDRKASSAQAAFRDLVLLAERGAALAWRMLIDWPPLIGTTPALAACADIRRTVAAVNAVADRSLWLRIGGARLRLSGDDLGEAVSALTLKLAALFPEAESVLSLPSLETALESGTSMPARLLRVARALPADYGQHHQPLLAERGADWFATRLAEEDDFSDRPTLDGVPAEVGALAAQRSGLIAAAMAQWGPGLATRLLAAALDAHVVAARISAALTRLADDEPHEFDATRAGCGAGVVETARGPLAYYVELDGGRVQRLRSVAPTEWNFHPDGPFLAALAAAPRVADPIAAARLLAASFDPCVPFDIVLVAAAAGEEARDA